MKEGRNPFIFFPRKYVSEPPAAPRDRNVSPPTEHANVHAPIPFTEGFKPEFIQGPGRIHERGTVEQLFLLDPTGRRVLRISVCYNSCETRTLFYIPWGCLPPLLDFYLLRLQKVKLTSREAQKKLTIPMYFFYPSPPPCMLLVYVFFKPFLSVKGLPIFFMGGGGRFTSSRGQRPPLQGGGQETCCLRK